MTTETEKSPRGTAEDLIRSAFPPNDYIHALAGRTIITLTSAIEGALRDRDERAAKIATKKAETLRRAAHVVQQPTAEALRTAELAINTADDIARAIRDK